jgi:hypothetical protein
MGCRRKQSLCAIFGPTDTNDGIFLPMRAVIEKEGRGIRQFALTHQVVTDEHTPGDSIDDFRQHLYPSSLS